MSSVPPLTPVKMRPINLFAQSPATPQNFSTPPLFPNTPNSTSSAKKRTFTQHSATPASPKNSVRRSLSFSCEEPSVENHSALALTRQTTKLEEDFQRALDMTQNTFVSTFHFPGDALMQEQVAPELSTFAQCHFANSPKPEKSQKPPEKPWFDRKRKKPESQLSTEEKDKKNKYELAERAHDKIRESCDYIGSGHFCDAYDRRNGFVFKVPRRDKWKESISNHYCFKQMEYRIQNYENLRKLEKNGAFPSNFKIADTTYNSQLAIITQEKLDRSLTIADLRKPEVLATIKKVIRFAHATKSTAFDISIDNLLVREIRDEHQQPTEEIVLTLIDWNEQDSDTFGDSSIRIHEALKSFAKLGDTPLEQTQIYRYLDPR